MPENKEKETQTVKRRRLLILNAVLAALALIVMTAGGALAFQPPLTILQKVVWAPLPVIEGLPVTYKIQLHFNQNVEDVRLLDVMRGKQDFISGSVAATCGTKLVVTQKLDTATRDDIEIKLGDIPASTVCDVFISALTDDDSAGTRILNDVTVYTNLNNFKGTAGVAAVVDEL
ncbi:MAG: hypothetical protein EPO21_06785 [Chloroflexota bacterium]|nr:MAG: hypothetical protein EPO21_06785 [Chloroflexota bacterium]